MYVCVCVCVLFIAPCITRLISFFFSLPYSCRSITCSSGGQTQSDIADRTSRHLHGAAAASVVTNRPAESILSLSSMTSLSLLVQIPGSSCRNICGYCEFRCVFRQMFSKFYFPVSFLYLSGSMHVENGDSVTYEPIIMCDVVFCKRHSTTLRPQITHGRFGHELRRNRPEWCYGRAVQHLLQKLACRQSQTIIQIGLLQRCHRGISETIPTRRNTSDTSRLTLSNVVQFLFRA